MTKRKRVSNGVPVLKKPPLKANIKSVPKLTPTIYDSSAKSPLTIQLVAGSYDGIIHGVTATILSDKVQFADTFLFTAHTSAIRCLALSSPSAPAPNQIRKIYLASGSTDERIHLYHLSAHAPSKVTIPAIPNLTSKPIVENPHNRELGSLLHHSSAITALYFPNRGKLLSSAEDRQIAVTRTRDWNVLCSIKSPIPKQIRRPSGDTAPTGGAPCGINDFAIHPSMKLMISVSKGENCMRLWNLVTGKKAGVLNFDKIQLLKLGEGKHSTGEGRKVKWGTTEAGDEFCVCFERGLIVYGMDSKPKCIALPEPRTKIHQVRYFKVEEEDMMMALSTEDGRIIFYSTKPDELVVCSDNNNTDALPSAKLVAQLGGKAFGLSGRIKDFSILIPEDNRLEVIILTAGSDGILSVWKLRIDEVLSNVDKSRPIGTLLGSYETNNRITCLEAFIMLPSDEGIEENEMKDESSSDGSSSDD